MVKKQENLVKEKSRLTASQNKRTTLVEKIELLEVDYEKLLAMRKNYEHENMTNKTVKK